MAMSSEVGMMAMAPQASYGCVAMAAAPAECMAANDEMDDLERRLAALSDGYVPPSPKMAAMPQKEEFGMAMASAASAVTVKTRPDFNAVIRGQSSSGNWDSSSLSVLKQCIIGSNHEDSAVKSAIASMSLTEGSESVYLTLLALHILKEVYADRADEHLMICQNAR